MKQIKLNIEDENLEIVLTILNNLKNGLIKVLKVQKLIFHQLQNTNQS